MERLLQILDPVFVFSFRIHDWLSDFLAKHSVGVKRLLLFSAVVFLGGIFYPEARKTLGEWGLNLLLVILFLSPLSKIFRARLLLILMGFRRQMGILFASLILAHSLSLLLDPNWFGMNIGPYLPDSLFQIPARILVGLAAFTLTLPLLLTSNGWAQQALGPNWKRLHWIVYPMFVLAVFHKFFIGPEGRGVQSSLAAWLQAGMLLGAYAFLKLLVWKQFLTPLGRAIEIVSSRYQTFRSASMAEKSALGEAMASRQKMPQ